MTKPVDSDDISRIVMLAYGTMNHGGPYWCYVAVRPGRSEAFRKALAGKNYNMQQFEPDGFGEIIVSGEGIAPPVEITHKVAAMFNVKVRDLFAEVDHLKNINLITQKVNE